MRENRRFPDALKKGADRFAVDAEADHTRAVVDLLDRLGRNEPAAAGEEPEPNSECVGRLRRGAVHRPLDPPDDAPLSVRHEESRRTPEIESESGHGANLFPPCKEIPLPDVRML